MSRPRRVIRPTSLEVSIPETIRGRLDLFLFSEVEGRVPLGAYSRLVTRLLSEFFEGEELPLSPYVPAAPHGTSVHGSKHAIGLLEKHLEAGALPMEGTENAA